NPVIMGRSTYESIGRPLPGRDVIVLSTRVRTIEGVTVVPSVEAALTHAQGLAGTTIYIGGGEAVYRTFLPLAGRIYLTTVHAHYGGDRHFPSLDGAGFERTASELVEGPVPYTYEVYDRIVEP